MHTVTRFAALPAAFVVAFTWTNARPLLAHTPNEIKPPSMIRVPVRHLETWIQEGLARSATLRSLVDRLERTRVIVYFGVSPMSSGTLGRTQIMGAGGDFRYIHIDVDDRLSRIPLLSIVGHELQHAVEIAEDTSVVDEASLVALYERIGVASGYRPNRTRWFETDAAIETGHKVYTELCAIRW
jgi:hypothetical protein